MADTSLSRLLQVRDERPNYFEAVRSRAALREFPKLDGSFSSWARNNSKSEDRVILAARTLMATTSALVVPEPTAGGATKAAADALGTVLNDIEKDLRDLRAWADQQDDNYGGGSASMQAISGSDEERYKINRSQEAVSAIANAAGSFTQAEPDFGESNLGSLFLEEMFSEDIGITDLFSLPLWPQAKTPEPTVIQWNALKKQLVGLPSGTVWIDWYERALLGHPQNWQFLSRIAHIPDDVWLADPTRLASYIEQIKSELCGDSISQVRRVIDAAPPQWTEDPPADIDPISLIELSARLTAHTQDLDDIGARFSSLQDTLTNLRAELHRNEPPDRATLEQSAEDISTFRTWYSDNKAEANAALIAAGVAKAVDHFDDILHGLWTLIHTLIQVL